jgi:hypothetical protein
MTEIAVPEKGGLELLAELERNGAISAIGLHLTDPDLSYDEFEAIGFLLGRMHQSLRFAIGDWLVLGEKLFPAAVYQAAEALGLSEEGMREYLRVSERVPRSTRRKTLSWSHHRAVAALEPPEQKTWLKKAVDEDLSHHALRDALRAGGVSQPARASRCRCCGREL